MSRAEPERRLLLLDLDGTLLDSFADIARGVVAAFAAIDVPPAPAMEALCRRGVGLEAFYRDILGRDPHDPAEAARFDRFVGAYRAAYLSGQQDTRPYPGVADTLARLHARGDLHMAVTTVKRTDVARAVLDRFGLTAWLDDVVGSDGLPPKPDPAVLRRAAERAGLPVEPALVVGDTDRDVGAARAAGCRACAVTYGGWSRDELAALAPDHMIDRFEDLEGLLP